MKVLSKEVTWKVVNDDELEMTTVMKELFTNEEALDIGQKHYNNLKQTEEQLSKFRKYLADKKYVEDEESLAEQAKRTEALVDVFSAATKGYVDKKEAEARVLIDTLKKKEKYESLKGDRRVACRSGILSTVAEKTGFHHVDHPVMMKMRVEFESIGGKER